MNSYNEFISFLNSLNHKPTLLLHSCCGGCSSYVLDFLNKYFIVTVHFINDNIYPKEEYIKRLDEQIKLVEALNAKNKVIAKTYENSLYDSAILGLEQDKEGGNRCYNCYKLRLDLSAQYAKEHNFDYFTTTLSVSPYKNSNWINEIGENLSKKYSVKFLYSNFKKEEGYKKSVFLSKKYNIYRQDYCGCRYSLADFKAKKGVETNESKNKEN